MSTHADPVEREDRWLLNLRGLTVTRVCVDYQLTLHMASPDWMLVLEELVVLSQGPTPTSPTVTLNPGAQDVAAALPLFGKRLLSGTAFKSGVVRLVFECGTHLVCGPGDAYEAWNLHGPGGWMFVSLPGGDLAVWSRRGS